VAHHANILKFSFKTKADPEAVVPVENEYSIPHALGSGVDTSLLLNQHY
jgi:hypothetical protein